MLVKGEDMTTSSERTTAVVKTRAFLQALVAHNDAAAHGNIHEVAEHLLRHYPLDVDLDASAAALPNLWAFRRDGIPRPERGDVVPSSCGEHELAETLVRTESGDEFDLTLALRTIRKWSVADGDLGYEYWSRVEKLLRRASEMQAQIDSLSTELERYRGRHGGGF